MGGSILLARRETNGKIGSTRSNLGNGLMDRGQTEACRLFWWSSKPTTEMSCGTRRP